MRFKVDDTHHFLVLIDSTELEYSQIESSFTKKSINWSHVRAKKPGAFKGFETKFIDRYGRIPLGLWSELQKFSKKYYFNLEIEGTEYLYDKNYDENLFLSWVDTYFENSDNFPRDYQIEGISRILKYKLCTEEISTSGGKTLMAFMLFKYLFDSGLIKKMLYVVPNVGLVTQTEEEFYSYEEQCERKPNWKSECVFGGAKSDKKIESNIVFGTFQSLSKKNQEYFSSFDVVFIDETHHAKAASIKNIILKCSNAKYAVGMTGTLPPEGSIDSFIIQSYIGPCVYVVKSDELIAAKFATPVKVIGLEMDYLNEEVKKKLYNLRNVAAEDKDGAKLLNLEKDLLRENRKRLVYVCNTIIKATKNSLVLFSDIKNEYGRTVFNYIKENSDKVVYYIDGSTPAKNRDYFKKEMESGENITIVASIGVFSEGINIKNVFNLFIVESSKSEYQIRQMLGRGMRLLEGKEEFKVIDFRDNYIYGTHKYQRINYLMRHAKERERIYKDRGFPFQNFKVKL